MRDLRPGEFVVSTRTLIAILVTTLAWEAEGFVIGIHFLGVGNLPDAAHAMLIATTGVLSIVSWFWARNEARQSPGHASRLVLLPGQGKYVVLAFVTFGVVIGVAMSLK
jgi:hypothetical protein